MRESTKSSRRPGARGTGRDYGRALARLVCAVFALVGLIPLALGLALRSENVRSRVANETSRLLFTELGLKATFAVELKLIPLRLELTDIQIPANDGGTPAASIRSLSVSPRWFSLLGGRLDVGDIEIEQPVFRIELKDGAVSNVTLRLPPSDPNSKGLTEAPFRSLLVSAARLELKTEDLTVVSDELDLDAFAETGLSFDVALRVKGATITRTRKSKTNDQTIVDEDRLCALDLRAHVSKEELRIQRLSLVADMDLEGSEPRHPSCQEAGPERLAVRLGGVHIKPKPEGIPAIKGRVFVRVPLPLAQRFIKIAEPKGWIGFAGEVAYDGSTKLPELSGQLSGAGLRATMRSIAEELNAQVRIHGDVVTIPKFYAKWANGEAHFEDVSVSPFAPKGPISVKVIHTKNMDFPGLMRDLDITAQTIVDWHYDRADIHNIRGTMSPFYVDGTFDADTSGFAVNDRSYASPQKRRMIGVKSASLAGHWRAGPKGVDFFETDAHFGKSFVPVQLVRIGYHNDVQVSLRPGTEIDLEDIGPIAAMSVKGRAKLDITLNADGITSPKVDGTVSVSNLDLGGFSVGDIDPTKVHFEPLKVDFTDIQGRHGTMPFTLPKATLDFGSEPTVLFTAKVASENFATKEFFEIFHFDKDPRYEGVRGAAKVEGDVRYILGGSEDPCDSGRLQIDAKVSARKGTGSEFLSLFDEEMTAASGQFRLDWFDMEAGSRGMDLFVPSFRLEKGTGSLFGDARVERNGKIRGHFASTKIPVSALTLSKSYLGAAEGYVTGSGELTGSLERLGFRANAELTSLKFGHTELGPSTFVVELIPEASKPASVGKTKCQLDIPTPFSLDEYARDKADGDFVVSGDFLGGTVNVDELAISSQKNKHVRGNVRLHRLPLGDLVRVVTVAPGSDENAGLKGTLSGTLELKDLIPSAPLRSEFNVTLTELSLEEEQFQLALGKDPLKLNVDKSGVHVAPATLALQTPSGASAEVIADGSISPNSALQANLTLRETSLGVLLPALPGVASADGRLRAGVSVSGTLAHPKLSGHIDVDDGHVKLASVAAPLGHLKVRAAIDEQGLHVNEAEGEWGGGRVFAHGQAPLNGMALGNLELTFGARDVSLSLSEDVDVTFNADLSLLVPREDNNEEEKKLPTVSGEVVLLAGSYERAMSMTADLADLTAKGKKTNLELVDPARDKVEFNVVLRAERPVSVKNSLVETALVFDPSGLHVTGTNQRFGVVGSIEVPPGGKIALRSNSFEIKSGIVRFTDPTKINPEVDVRAQTDFQRTRGQGSTAVQSTSGASSGSATSSFRILLRAYGNPENLKIDLTSDPPLAQDDIFLLLTVGMTRTELDQARNAGVGSAVALEALGSLSGAENAVTDTVPIDEFRFGSLYSTKSGKSEPTVTIGKRLSERIRATVTSSMSDTSEVRSNVEYRATDHLSLEGSYDNAQRAGAPAIGNIGGNVRWRLEFE